MRYDENYTSSDVEDRRAEGPVAGGGGGIPIGGLFYLLSRFGWHGLILGALIVGGIMIAGRLGGGGGGGSQNRVAVETGPEEAKLVHFVEYVFDDVQRTWAKQVSGYRKAKLVLFRQSARSACGVATSAVGPFYCPGDSKVYIDLAFYDELRRRFGAPGDFAQAYVIAHELGHHIQNLLNLDSRGGSTVPIELQADCLAGAWARDANQRNLVEVGDVDEALNAATQIGDDTLQRKAGHQVQPETWTHGSSAQRSSNFKKGYEDGPRACGVQL
jgi:predicted metalloprotease